MKRNQRFDGKQMRSKLKFKRSGGKDSGHTWLKTQARKRDLKCYRKMTDYDNEKKSEENMKTMYRK
jgi:hypothetical protein